MAELRLHSIRNGITHNPARLLDENLDGVPEAWRQTMQLSRPIEGLNIHCMHGQPGADWAFQSQGEPNLTIALLLEGRMEAGIEDGTAFQLEPGQALLMAVGAAVGGWNVLSPKRNIHLLNINLSPQALPGLTGMQLADVLKTLHESRCGMAHVDVGMARLSTFSALHRIAAEIARSDCLHAPARKIFVCAKAAECLALMLNHTALNHAGPRTLRTTPCTRPKLLRARALLEQRYAESWSVSSLAHAVSLNEKRLQAGFQALYGCTVHTCLTRIRLDIAKTMLASGRSVTDTAHAAGFSNISHFSKTFRQQTGRAPGRWAQGMAL